MVKRPQDLLSVLGVPSQLKMLNLDCLAPGKSMAHFVGVCDKDHKGTSTHPQCPQCPGGPESAQSAHLDAWVQGRPQTPIL